MKKSVYYLSFLFLIFAATLQSYGQDVQVTGKVTDATIGETIPGVSILVKIPQLVQLPILMVCTQLGYKLVLS